MQLFSKTRQWASLTQNVEQYWPSSDTLYTSILAMFEPGKHAPLDIPMGELALWLGKYTGITHDRTLWVEAYTTCALSKAPHSNAARLGKYHQETAMVKDHLTRKWMRLEKSQQLDKELYTLAPSSPPSPPRDNFSPRRPRRHSWEKDMAKSLSN